VKQKIAIQRDLFGAWDETIYWIDTETGEDDYDADDDRLFLVDKATAKRWADAENRWRETQAEIRRFVKGV
jgi:hypothetical protein